MNNKVLVTFSVPSLEAKYDIFIPVNRKVYNVINMVKNSLYELSNGAFMIEKDYILYSGLDGNAYDMNLLIRDTDIRNDSKVILL